MSASRSIEGLFRFLEVRIEGREKMKKKNEERKSLFLLPLSLVCLCKFGRTNPKKTKKKCKNPKKL